MKKGGDLFDVAMVAYDGAEVCKLVGTLSEKIGEICNEGDIGLHRDDGLAIFRNKRGTQLHKKKRNCKDYLKNAT